MEQFLAEVEAYADAVGYSPQWVLRRAINAGGGEWASWRAGKSSPTMARADLVRNYMAAHPPRADEGDAA